MACVKRGADGLGTFFIHSNKSRSNSSSSARRRSTIPGAMMGFPSGSARKRKFKMSCSLSRALISGLSTKAMRSKGFLSSTMHFVVRSAVSVVI